MTASIEDELEKNHTLFKKAVFDENGKSASILDKDEGVYLKSYKLICAFRGWHEISLPGTTSDVAGFFIEAHNDLLTAHVHAMFGMWRSASISLRSFMESYLSFIYFKDHSIELELWKAGKFKIEPKNLRVYCANHPVLTASSVVKNATGALDKHYSELSGFVHGAKVDFRMTKQTDYPAISSPDSVRLKKWQSLQGKVVGDALIIFLGLYSGKMTGASHLLFRKVLGTVISKSKKTNLKVQLSINIP